MLLDQNKVNDDVEVGNADNAIAVHVTTDFLFAVAHGGMVVSTAATAAVDDDINHAVDIGNIDHSPLNRTHRLAGYSSKTSHYQWL